MYLNWLPTFKNEETSPTKLWPFLETTLLPGHKEADWQLPLQAEHATSAFPNRHLFLIFKAQTPHPRFTYLSPGPPTAPPKGPPHGVTFLSLPAQVLAPHAVPMAHVQDPARPSAHTHPGPGRWHRGEKSEAPRETRATSPEETEYTYTFIALLLPPPLSPITHCVSGPLSGTPETPLGKMGPLALPGDTPGHPGFHATQNA